MASKRQAPPLETGSTWGHWVVLGEEPTEDGE